MNIFAIFLKVFIVAAIGFLMLLTYSACVSAGNADRYMEAERAKREAEGQAEAEECASKSEEETS